MFIFSKENTQLLILHLWMISVAHMDSPYVVDIGLTQMLSLVDQNSDAEFDVHLIGGFEDVYPKVRPEIIYFL